MQFACFRCRKAFKQPVAHPRRLPEEQHICPDCGGEMQEMGRYFRAPKRGDVEQWMKVQALAEAGFTFHSSYSNRVGNYPERLRDVESFIENAKRRLGRISEGEELLRRIKGRGC